MRYVIVLALGLLMAAASSVPAQSPPGEIPPADTVKVWKATDGQWMAFPDIFPPGGEMKVIHGDPAAGPADFYFKFPSEYGVPWHFHTPVERVFVDRGTMEFEVRGREAVTLSKGGYISLPGKHPHTATCTSSEDCYFFLSSSGPFDIHLVGDQGQVTRSWRCCG